MTLKEINIITKEMLNRGIDGDKEILFFRNSKTGKLCDISPIEDITVGINELEEFVILNN